MNYENLGVTGHRDMHTGPACDGTWPRGSFCGKCEGQTTSNLVDRR